MRPLTDGSRLARSSLIADLVALAVTLAIGVSRHGEDAASTYLALVAIVGTCWIAVTWAVGTYRPVTNLGLALALIIVIPLSVLIRAPFRDWTVGVMATVAGVLLLFSAFFVGLGRLIVALTARGKETG